jgi:photosynthetic reaction center cytochrome c subunit
MSKTTHLIQVLLAGVAAVLLSGCERPPPEAVQRGYRGTGMLQVYNLRSVEISKSNNVVPVALPPVDRDGVRSSLAFQNVKVLGDTSVAEFTRLMTAITSWVAPQQGCVYCHNLENFAEDSKYTKVVARRMIQMTRTINTEWQTHVVATGVTCYTCHRGAPVPANIWFKAPPQANGSNFIGDKAGQNTPLKVVDLSSLPNDPFTPFLLGSQDIRVNGTVALPAGNKHSIKQAEWTYGLMTHMSLALGVNCTYCHNTRSFAAWDGNPPQRAVAWYGIRMARELNNSFLEPLTSTFPANRLGPTGDAPKLNCLTCHQGAYKPLYGVSMLKDHPELAVNPTAPTTPTAPPTEVVAAK